MIGGMADVNSPPSSYADFRHLQFERPTPGVLLVTIDRPQVLNAANERLHREFSELWPVVDADESVAVSVITGAGRAFSAGGDLAMVERMKQITGRSSSSGGTPRLWWSRCWPR